MMVIILKLLLYTCIYFNLIDFRIFLYKMKYSSCYAKILNINTIIVVVFFSIVFSTVNSCYITNCPWGGKRSLSESQTTFHYVS